MFKECADIQTADMLKLPVPALVGGKPTNIQLKPSEIQKQMVTELGERADKIRNKMVKPYEDNMLKITNDGRKLALDQRLIDPDLPDDPDSKVNICVGKIFEIWEQTMPQRSAQLVFCDLSTPKAGVFNVYDDMKAKLIERGIPETEIAFIHEANTDARKTELFGKVRSGAVRVLMAARPKWERAPMCNSVLWRCTIWMYRGGHLILSSVRAEYYDRAMKIRRSMFSVM